MPNFYADTHPGCVEESNEDSIGWDEDRQIWLVADGMGGHAKGEVASRLVKDTILEEVSRELPLRQTVLDAHRVVAEAAKTNEGGAGMGSTVVAVQINDQGCDVVWVGDSRAYLWSKGRLRRISRDHSFLELLLANKAVTAAQAREHPKRHLVTQTLGMGEPSPDEEHVDLRKRDWLLLCSDGLHDELTDDEIADYLRRSGDPRQAVDNLIAAALNKGGRDNVSVVIVECERGAHARGRRFEAHPQWKPIALGIIGALVVFLLLEWLTT